MKTTNSRVGILAMAIAIWGSTTMLAGCNDNGEPIRFNDLGPSKPGEEAPSNPNTPPKPEQQQQDEEEQGKLPPGVWSGNRASLSMNFINNRSNLVADFAKIENEPVWRAIGNDCKVQNIDFKSLPKVTRIDAGELTAKGSVAELKAKIDAQQRYFATTDTIIAQPNENIEFSWTGSFIGMPGTSSAARPEKIIFANPFPTEFQWPANSELSFSFSGGGSSWVGVLISQADDQGSTSILCRFRASSGMATMGTSVRAELKPDIAQTSISVNTFNEKTEMMGDWQVNTTVSEPLASALIKF